VAGYGVFNWVNGGVIKKTELRKSGGLKRENNSFLRKCSEGERLRRLSLDRIMMILMIMMILFLLFIGT